MERGFSGDFGVFVSLLVMEDAFCITLSFEQLSNRNTLGCIESDCDVIGLVAFNNGFVAGLDKGCGVFGVFS